MSATRQRRPASRGPNELSVELEADLERHRGELTGHCSRLLGSRFDAEDAVQETMVRAWRALARFEGRASLRTWLYRIATNVCYDLLEARGRRALPMDLGPSSPHDADFDERPVTLPLLLAATAGAVDRVDGDPAEAITTREAVHEAFVRVLRLPPRQRAVLIFRDVLRWRASEVATALGTTVASVTSSLQRARENLARTDHAAVPPRADGRTRALLHRYVDAFEHYDVASLVPLLRADALLHDPPFGEIQPLERAG